VTKPNKSWKKKGDDKSPKTQLEREDPKKEYLIEIYGEENMKEKARKMILHLKMKKLIIRT
jgi:hypothetical protein